MEIQENSHLSQALSKLDDVRTRALEWIGNRVSDDGEPAGARQFNTYYRLPWALSAGGNRELASKTLAWIERNALDARGDLREGCAREPFMHSNASYPLAQIVIGAWGLEQYDVANRVWARIRQDYLADGSQGAFAERPEVRKTRRTDVLVSAQVGLAALTVNDMEAAQRLYFWFETLYGQQPSLPARLYQSMIDAKVCIPSSQEGNLWALMTDFHQPRQQFFNPGIAAAFLARYHARTGSEDALALARKFLELNVLGADLQFDHRDNAQICKFGWGAAALLDVQPDTANLAHVLRMVDWFRDAQCPDGRWHPSPFLVPEPTDADDMPKTAEHLLHVATLSTSLARLRGSSPVLRDATL